ncbi:MAG: pyruvate dehydrogenase complex dihydrolipoamide acetyltransferase [Alphaproteobacteria bacterium]|nr:pyruvate dehydrogenase complex dihydrolipoamide acetyltransferase [Alphaproteobacteria bacterium]
MPIEILMPALSPTMTEGTLAKWHVKEGDEISAGKVIAEIETDKATMEVEAVDEGVMGKILINEGAENVPVNQAIALLLEEGEDKKALADYKPKSVEPPKEEAAEEDLEEDSEEKSEKKTAKPAAQSGGGLAKPQFAIASHLTQGEPAAAGSARGADENVFASPLAKRIAEQEGVDLAKVAGHGPNGRIVAQDVLDAKASGVGLGAGMTKVVRNPSDYYEVPVSGMRKTIAKRLTESKQWVPHFYLNVECHLDKLMDMRKELNGQAAADAGKDGKPAFKLSVNDFIIKAVSAAMKKVPEANASWIDDKVYQYNNIDISVAVAIEGGLITPIVANADQKSVIMISNEMKDLAGRARKGKLQPEEYQGGGFSISNLGMFGIKNFNAIVNPPQACILAVGAGEQRVVVKNGVMQPATVMDCTLSVDHRVVDGAVGAQFLSAFKHYIESPSLLLV